MASSHPMTIARKLAGKFFQPREAQNVQPESSRRDHADHD